MYSVHVWSLSHRLLHPVERELSLADPVVSHVAPVQLRVVGHEVARVVNVDDPLPHSGGVQNDDKLRGRGKF